MKQHKGGSGKKTDALKHSKKKSKRALKNLVRVEYLDHVLCKNVDPNYHKPVLREVVGWIIHEDYEFILIICERPITMLNEEIQPEVSIIILKSAIFGIWDLNRQSLRSRKNKQKTR